MGSENAKGNSRVSKVPVWSYHVLSATHHTHPKIHVEFVWYQWVSKGYPLVYDPLSPGDVIGKFRGKTSLYGDPSNRDCSLLITRLETSHHGEKLYTWIDPENVGYRTYAFYDVTATILVEGM